MAGLVDLLNIAKTAMQTHQRQLDVTGHNIANASTPGYTRERLNVIAEVPLRTPLGTVGRGVTDTGVVAERDTFLDTAYRTQQGNLSRSSTLNDILTQLQSAFNEPSDNGFGTALDTMFGAFGDLANDPSSGAARVSVRQAAVQLTQQLHTLDENITTLNNTARGEFQAGIDRIGAIATQVASLNAQIVAQGGTSHSAPDLEDKRGVLLDELGGLVDTRVLNRADGSVGVIAGDTLLVDGGVAQQVEARTRSDGTLGVGVVGDTRVMEINGGKLAGLSDTMNTALPAVRAALDQLASGVVSAVNALHESGMTSGGVAGTDFFDPAGVTAATMAVAPSILTSADNIVTGTTTAAGDNAIALQLAALRTTSVAALGNATPGEFYTGLVTDLATVVNTSQQDAATSTVLVSGISAQRSSETGVSTNDELVALITQQSAFAAAAKIVNVADTLMQDVLNMVQ